MKIEKTWRSSRMLVAELIVVFLGVYGAFWVDNYRDQQEREERTEQVILILQQDLKDFIEVSGGFADQVDEGLLEWSNARDRGETPPPFIFRIYGAEKPPQSTWEAVRQSQVVELLQADLLYELGFFYNEISGIGDRYLRYVKFVESAVLPLLKTGSASFYAEDGGRMLPRFEANMDRLREWNELGRDTVEWANCLVGRLESAGEKTAACRSGVGVTAM
jgi:hypothetical protein